jgi:acetyl esterase/lipase
VISYDELVAEPPPRAGRRIAYGDDPLQFGDLWVPADAADKRTTVVLVHGGCWEAEYPLDHASYLAQALARAGYVVWVPEYRRLGDAGGGWPGTLEDVGAAVDFVRRLSELEPAVDAGRVILSGHSAGGQLALWAASRAGRPQHSPALRNEPPLAPIGVVGLAAITDLATYSAGSGDCNSAVVRLLGGTPMQQPERYRDASPLALLPIGVRLALLHGDLDSIVPIASTNAFGRAAEEAGDQVNVTVITGAGHFEVIAPRSFAWPAVLAAFQGISPPR